MQKQHSQTVSPETHDWPSLGLALIEKGILSEDQLRIALLDQVKSGLILGKILVSLGFVSEDTLRDALSESLGKRSIDLAKALIDPSALKRIPREIAERHHLLPLNYDDAQGRLTLAVSDPNDIVALDCIQGLTGKHVAIETILAGQAEIDRAIDQAYGYELSINGILHEIETGEITGSGTRLAGNDYSQPIVRLIDAILNNAVTQEASDIHFEPESGFLRIRYRIDGLLRQIRSLHKAYWPAMAVRLKVMSNMNIAETRAPQEGRISLSVRGQLIDLRVSVQPTINGENIVLRILDRHKGLLSIDQLGLSNDQRARLDRMITRPEGIILVTGPTGSGKTTTLYSVLAHLNTENVNIMTLEDPVEYQMTRIRQTTITESSKLDFVNGIKSMMRQDPDIILIGEIRDAETAEMAFRAAMTGHQVYATLHTNSALGAIPRLLDIGILPEIMASNMIGIIAQRLIRRLCPYCKVAVLATDEETSRFHQIENSPNRTLFRPTGCKRCDFQGYRGRVAIMEILHITADIDDLITCRSTAREIHALAVQQGFISLADDGLRRVADGTSTLAELQRVVDLDNRL